ncbi:MAG: DUF502 domain-containing protein [Candidatus Marinimicrobia bacterium]|nr:DUF502 domain-containing protein [Candidatus Neomarinimicrobiota bacterium]
MNDSANPEGRPSHSIRLRRIFITGILTAIPAYITIQLLVFLFRFMDRILAPVITRFIGFHIPGLGLAMMLIFIFVLGLFVTNFLGRRLYHFFENFLLKVPVVSSIYNTSKQIVNTFSPDNRKAFQKVIWLEYPRRGIWSLGFVTGQSRSSEGEEYYNIFIATTPNPTSGFVIFVPVADTIESGLSIEEGFKLLISAGMLSADRHMFGNDKAGTSKKISSGKLKSTGK